MESGKLTLAEKNNILLQEIRYDMATIKQDTSVIKLDLNVIIAKLREKEIQEKRTEKDNWWLASLSGR